MRFVILLDSHPDDFEMETFESLKNTLNQFGKVEVLHFKPLFLNELRKDDVVFNLAVGKRHDFAQGFISAALEAANIEFVGSPAYTHYVSLDKFTTKSLLKAYGISTPSGAIYDGKKWRGDIPHPPLMVKPSSEGSGIGVDEKSLCFDVKEAQEVAKEKFLTFKEPILVEEYIQGKEITVGVLGDDDRIEVLPPLEIDFSNLPNGIEKYYSKRVKEEYAEETVYRCPPAVDKDVLEVVKEMAVEVFKVIKARDFIRMDMRISNGIPYLIEVNSRPGLHPSLSDIPKMVKAISKDYDWLVKRIVRRALKNVGGAK